MARTKLAVWGVVAVVVLVTLIALRRDGRSSSRKEEDAVPAKPAPTAEPKIVIRPNQLLDKVGNYRNYPKRIGNGLTQTFLLGFPSDAPQVELRFLFRRPNGALEVCEYKNELRLTAISEKAREYPHALVGGTTWRDDQNRPRGIRAVRYPAVNPSQQPFPTADVLLMGGVYKASFRWKNGDEDTRFYQSIFRVPEQIAPGDIAEIPLVTNDFWPPKPTDTPKYLIGKLPFGTLPKEVADLEPWLVGYYTDFTKRHLNDRFLDESGEFRIPVLELGGTFIARQAKAQGLTWLYIRKVTKLQLSLPQDADVVMDVANAVDFDLVIPEQHLPKPKDDAKDFVCTYALANASDPNIPLNVCKIYQDDNPSLPKSNSQWRRLFTNRKIHLRCPPGEYILFCKGGGIRQEIGQVVVTKDSKGRILPILGVKTKK